MAVEKAMIKKKRAHIEAQQMEQLLLYDKQSLNCVMKFSSFFSHSPGRSLVFFSAFFLMAVNEMNITIEKCVI
jgi:hypothetical protein